MKEHPSEKRMTTGKLTELALLTAAALILYVVELQIPNPIPIPGAKLGLANIVTVYAVYRYRPGEVLMVVLVRIFLGSLFGGSMMTFLYSLAGSLLCLLGMLLLRHMVSGRAIWLALPPLALLFGVRPGRRPPQHRPDAGSRVNSRKRHDLLPPLPHDRRLHRRSLHRPVRAAGAEPAWETVKNTVKIVKISVKIMKK